MLLHLFVLFLWRFFLLRRCLFPVAAAAILLLATVMPAHATVFATVRGIVHDPQHRPISHARVTLQSANSAFVLHTVTNADGEFQISNAPLGVYRLIVSARDFETVTQALTLASGTTPILHLALPIGPARQSVVVHGDEGVSDSVTPTTLVTRGMIAETPGADSTLGMQMITDYVPGA